MDPVSPRDWAPNPVTPLQADKKYHSHFSLRLKNERMKGRKVEVAGLVEALLRKDFS